MEETREMTAGEAMALAQADCVRCFGIGKRQGRNGTTPTCHCVWRHVFRICFNRFRRLYFEQGGPKTPAYDPREGHAQNKPNKRASAEEYLADFVIVARNALRDRTFSQKVFKYHFLYGADWRLCARKLKIDRGTIFHEIYRVEQSIGQALYETRPFALYPLDEYFGGTVRGAIVERSLLAFRSSAAAIGRPLRAPLSTLAMEAV